MLSKDEICIIAQCTPQGSGALALLRISGTGARNLVDGMARLASSKNIPSVKTHTIHFGSVVDTHGKSIDQVMFIVMDGPRTFTGQDTIEITCHNNPFLIKAIIDLAISRGARHAQEGEFTRRAFDHGKIDLIQAESIHELIAAQTQQALKKSLAHLEGSFSHWIETLEKDLLKIIAWCEASFEFLDEEQDFKEPIIEQLKKLVNKIATIKQTFQAEQQIRQGIKIALIGSVNAGKSSLFNTLLNKERAIVTDVAGTTRDVIEAGYTTKNAHITFVDTAGLRTTADSIEKEGIKRSYEEAHKADIILLAVDGSTALSDQEKVVYMDLYEKYQNKCIFIETKKDCAAIDNSLRNYCKLAVSSKTGENIEALKDTISTKIETLFKELDSPFLLNKRQQSLLLYLENNLSRCLEAMESPHYELISYQLQDALSTLSELTGKTISEASLDMVFKEFCVGK